ncbi:ABC transporter substrate-binding protein [Salinivibrio sp. KP-1]|uniref:substrate-binding periplasmic protein n=1 Tax=Salinivibrio sp. KP-1 TaxID=1406902 RepID=UPI0006146BDB|nr:transporter substrate-binding domain-containing protein [Salinivibrio sp. KP-1]KKA45894.1 hypothetical protein WN56_01880 [Salinivibrio sp. KP-1]
MRSLITAFLLSLSFAATAQVKLVTLEYPPYITHEDKVVGGVAVELVERVFEEIEQPITIQVLPWGRAIKYVETGEADGIFTAFKTEERETFAHYIDEVLFDQNIVAIGSQGNDATWNKENIGQFKICLINNVSYGRWLDSMVEQNRFKGVRRVSEPEQCVQLLQANRVDFWVNNEFGARYVAAQMGVQSDISIQTPPLESTPSYIAFSKKGQMSEQDVKRVNDTVAKMKESGAYDQLIDKYFEDLASKN